MIVLLACTIGALLGVMLFFAASVTPTAFRKLPAEQASIYIRNIFPQYYLWGIVLAVMISVLAWGIDRDVFIIAALVTVLFLFSRLVLVPMIDSARAARDAGDQAGTRRFRRLHRISVLINLSQMVMLCVTAWMLMQVNGI